MLYGINNIIPHEDFQVFRDVTVNRLQNNYRRFVEAYCLLYDTSYIIQDLNIQQSRSQNIRSLIMFPAASRFLYEPQVSPNL